MTGKSIKLVSPDNTPIVGALLDDGSTCSASMTYDSITSVVDIVFDHNGESKLSETNGEIVYVDEKGSRWLASAVVDHSLFNRHM